MPDYSLDPEAAAAYLGVHPYTVKKWARDGKLRAVKTPGGQWRFSREDLDASLTPNMPEPENAA